MYKDSEVRFTAITNGRANTMHKLNNLNLTAPLPRTLRLRNNQQCVVYTPGTLVCVLHSALQIFALQCFMIAS